MKTKFLCYSRTNHNQVVWHYAELEKVGEGVYTYLQRKDQYREENDMIATVLQLEDVFSNTAFNAADSSMIRKSPLPGPKS